MCVNKFVMAHAKTKQNSDREIDRFVSFVRARGLHGCHVELWGPTGSDGGDFSFSVTTH
jgi:hypothetical protein